MSPAEAAANRQVAVPQSPGSPRRHLASPATAPLRRLGPHGSMAPIAGSFPQACSYNHKLSLHFIDILGATACYIHVNPCLPLRRSLSTDDQKRLARAPKVLAPVADVVRKVGAALVVVDRDRAAAAPALREAHRRALLRHAHRAADLRAVVLDGARAPGAVELLPVDGGRALQECGEYGESRGAFHGRLVRRRGTNDALMLRDACPSWRG
ncbi:hypothetical protein PHLGIDRAFT_322406 [Phlebiopsis gigantea 11061_1 CR5-6]|uniref:Uncharacterized protein n=1 Tax=Phlebiopsis gigantea (strain 11061_1 CR5-6) TaxID=745531 RepID=A0A0C3SD62_PHLG1|nr:hypothetical protein PHLGIDRAFT_322406 [Phlebiopsis gigantea 11061_1 CR5-6]